MHQIFRRSLFAAATLAAFLQLRAQDLFTETFSGETISSNWVYFDSTKVRLGNNGLLIDAGNHAIAYFTQNGPRTLAVNETLQVSLTLTFNQYIGSTAGTTGFRIGFFDSNGAQRPTALASGASTVFQGYDGFLVSWNPNPSMPAPSPETFANNVRVRVRTPLGSGSAPASTQLMSSLTSSNPSPGTSTYSTTGIDRLQGTSDPVRQPFELNTAYTVTFSIKRTTETALNFNFTATGGSLSNFTASFGTTSALSSTFGTSAFDAFGIYSTSDPGSNILIDNLTISVVPEPSTYAACAGAAVLGLAFWRRRRAAAKAAVA